MSSDVRVRFAPSPTGYLHVGGARTALFNWLFARKNHGTFILRIEDTDAARNTPQALAAIFDGLRWLGLEWDEGPGIGGPAGPYFQSQRQAVYDRRLKQLEDSRHVYREPGGAVRFKSPRRPITMHDRVCGDITLDRSEEPDMTLRRPDGSYIFHFTNVVDDIEMRISHVIRGEDHVMNTPKHLELFGAFGVAPPEYAHIPLILNMDGSKMSKRDRGAALHTYIDEAFVPAAVRNFLCLLGWSSKDDRQKLAIEDVIELFTWDHLNRAPARFDLEKCLWLNSEYLAEADDARFITWAESWLANHPPPDGVVMTAGQLEAALRLLKPKIKHVPELHEHLSMLFNPQHAMEPDARAKVAAKPEVRAALADVAARFASIDSGAWTSATVKAAIESAAGAAGVKSGALMFPLRVALTGAGHGADLLPALEIIGTDAVIDRLYRRLPLLFT